MSDSSPHYFKDISQTPELTTDVWIGKWEPDCNKKLVSVYWTNKMNVVIIPMWQDTSRYRSGGDHQRKKRERKEKGNSQEPKSDWNWFDRNWLVTIVTEIWVRPFKVLKLVHITSMREYLLGKMLSVDVLFPKNFVVAAFCFCFSLLY